MSNAPAGPSVRCFGAVRTVTGSMHLVEVNGDKLLLDCGLFQGHRAEARQRNARLPFEPREVGSVVLSHAHIDHCGNLPSLVKGGFRGPIYCTRATKDLAEVLLEDSAHIQQKDAEFYNKRAARRGDDDRVEPLYDLEDVHATVDRFHSVPYDFPVEVARGVRAVFRDAGHILGSASVGLTIDPHGGSGGQRRLTFTGDLGRTGMPIIRDPRPFDAADLIISESTYGDRLHPSRDDTEQILCDVIARTAGRGGKVIVPAFSVGRTQNLVYWLHRLHLDGRLPRLPIYVDSPLSSKATLVYRGHPECYDRETHEAFLAEGLDPFGFSAVTYVTSTDGSKALNDLEGPAVIISASGMCEAGRILHHLRHHAPDPRSTILLVGFQAEHTLGRRLLDGAPQLKIYGEMVERKAEVATMSGLSAHADRDGLLDLFHRLPREGRPRALLVHGEPSSSTALIEPLAAIGTAAVLPEVGQRFEI